MGVGVLTGLFLSGDLDVDNGNVSMYYTRAIHPVIGTAWRWYWLPYGRLIGHRSALSHLPVLSTFIRLACVLWPFWWWAGHVWWPPLAFTLGLCYADLLHWMADVVVSWWKRKAHL